MSAMTPAEELRAAAAKLRKLATDATPGPWRRPLDTRYKHTVDAALPEGEGGSYLDGVDPTTGERERSTVATVPIWSNGKHARARGGRDLEYIAAMHPGAGAGLADWFAFEADLIERVPGAELQGRTRHALAVARAINGGAS